MKKPVISFPLLGILFSVAATAQTPVSRTLDEIAAYIKSQPD